MKGLGSGDYRSGNLFPKAWISRVWELVIWTQRLGSGTLNLWSWAQVDLDLDFWVWTSGSGDLDPKA